MTTLRNSEKELEHAASASGWFTADWTPKYHPKHKDVDLEELRWIALESLAAPASEQFYQVVRDLLVAKRTIHRPQARAQQALQSFIGRLTGQLGVEFVAAEETGDELRIWTVMNEYDRDVEDRVYAAEAATLEAYRELRFFFRILFRHGCEVGQTVPTTATILLENASGA